MAPPLVIEIVGDTSKLEKALKGSQSRLSTWKKIGVGAAIGVGSAIAVGLGKAAKIGWDEFNQGQKVAAQTNAVLKSTGGVANVTAKDVERLGEQLMLKSGIDDEVIKSGENMLLTFRNIRNEAGKGNKIFDEATKATLDLSVATGKDMTSASVMVGKALNDPIKGITALRRVGVQFTEQQEKQIEKMVESGDVMGAQKAILKELNKEFGGSAEAAGETFGGQINILRERMNNWLGDMTAKAIPVLKRFGEWLMPLVEKAVRFVGDVINDLVIPAVQSFADVIREHEPQLRRMWEKISTAVQTMWRIVRPVLKFLLTEVLPRYLGIAITAIDKLLTALQKIIDTGKRVKNWFTGTFVRFWTNLWEGVKDTFNRFKLWITAKALRLVLDIVEPFSHLPSKMGQWARDVKDRVKPQLDRVEQEIKDMGDEADKVSGKDYKVTFTTNARNVGAAIGILGNKATEAAGDFGSFGFGRTSLVALGRQLQSMGFQVGEHPAFGGVAPVHVPGSYHYAGRALDINWPGGGAPEMSRLDWLYSRLRNMPGVVELLWRTAGHFDHLHVAMDRGGVVPGPRGRPIPVLAHGGETFIPTHRNGSGGRMQLALVAAGPDIIRWLQDQDHRYRRGNGGKGIFG